MIIGHDKLQEDFKKLADSGHLSHAYIFFGEPQVGKFLFAQHLANYLENQSFTAPDSLLKETLIISLDYLISEDEDNKRETIGIDAVRLLQHFLYQKPIFSFRRTVIVRDAENLTKEAQNAILKVVEEPPKQSLIIFIASNPDILFPTLLSRLQKIYFSRIKLEQIADFLAENFRLSAEKAKSVASESFGRPGMAVELIKNKELRIKNYELNRIVENNQIDEFFKSLIGDLAKDPVKNHKRLKQALERLVLIKQFNVNKKLQLRTIGIK